jgi:DNA-binding CsgD family transcriptional regulator/tetratricopeptide (TPR) repeat protein
VASLDAAREAEAVWGLAEARAHVERALTLWDAVPGAAELVGLDLAELCSWAAELAYHTGAAPRAVDLGSRAIELVGDGDPLRAASLHLKLGPYLYATGHGADARIAVVERAVELVPAEPPSPERAQALAALAHAYNIAWRPEKSRATCEQALALARTVGAREVELRALTTHGAALAYLGFADEGLAEIHVALRAAEESADPPALQRAYVFLTDVLAMLGRLRESARLAAAGLDAMHGYGMDNSTLIANRIEALVAMGEWNEAERVSANALRAITANYPHQILFNRARLEVGRGNFDDARAHLAAVVPHIPEEFARARYDTAAAELALWERRWTDAEETVQDGLATRTRPPATAVFRVQLCAQGMRAQAELTSLARARRRADVVHDRLRRARKLLVEGRRAAAEASGVTPEADGWRAVAEAEYERARSSARPELWADAANTWDQLERPPVAAYCRWRQAEALVAAGAPRAEATVALRAAHAVATRLGARPLLRELELLAERARLELTPPETEPPKGRQELQELGLTPREAEVLTLVARGLTNREIAAQLVISVKTADAHVSHILGKLDAPSRREAAAIAHRLAPPPAAPPDLGA